MALWIADRRRSDAAIYERFAAAATSDGAAARRGPRHAGHLGSRARRRRGREAALPAGDRARRSRRRRSRVAQAREQLALFLHFSGECDAAVALLQQLQPWISEHATDARKVDFYGDLGIVLDNADRGREARARITSSRSTWRGASAPGARWWPSGHPLRSAGRRRATWRARSSCCTNAAPGRRPRRGPRLRFLAADRVAQRRLRDCGRYADALNWVEPALAADGQLAAWKPLVRCQVACTWITSASTRVPSTIDAALAARKRRLDAREGVADERARMRLGLGRGMRELIGEARALAAQSGRRSLRASIALDHGLSLAPAEALAAAREVADGDRLGPAQHRARRTHSGRCASPSKRDGTEDALFHARASAAIDAEIVPNDLYPAERWLNAWRAWQLAGQRRGGRGGADPGRGVDSHDAAGPGARGIPRQLHARQPVNQQLLRAAPTEGLDVGLQ